MNQKSGYFADILRSVVVCAVCVLDNFALSDT